MKRKEDLVKSWFTKAERDLKTAEKYLKGYMVWYDIEPKKTHDLEDLILILGEKDKGILAFKDKVISLTPLTV